MIYSEADIKPQWAYVAKITTEKCFLNDKMILAAVHSPLTQCLTQTTTKHSKVCPTIKIKIYFGNIFLYVCRYGAKRLSPLSTRLLDVLLCITLPVYLLPCRGSLSAWSFILMKWAKPEAKGRSEWRERELFSVLSAMMQFIIKMQIQQIEGRLSSPCFHFTPKFSREAHLCPGSMYPSQ